jgi:type VI secretion system secreted protein Hcp
VQDLSFTKYVDASSSPLQGACCKGDHFTEAKLTVRKAGGSPVEYIIITMKEVIVTSLSTGGSGGEDRLTENITLNFAEYKMQYQKQDTKGAPDGGTIDWAWNIAENVPA